MNTSLVVSHARLTINQALTSCRRQTGEAVQLAQSRLRETRQTVSAGIQNRVVIVRTGIQNTKRSVSRGCQIVNQTCRQVINRIQQFISDHKTTLFLLACSALTAYVSPIIFTVTFILSVLATVEIDRRINNYANQQLAAANAQAPIRPYGSPGHTTVFEIALGTIAATHAFLISTIFLPASLTVAVVPPLLGAAAVGHVCAKAGLDMARHWNLI